MYDKAHLCGKKKTHQKVSQIEDKHETASGVFWEHTKEYLESSTRCMVNSYRVRSGFEIRGKAPKHQTNIMSCSETNLL